MSTTSGMDRADRQRDAWRAEQAAADARAEARPDAAEPVSIPDPVSPTTTEELRDTRTPNERFRDAPSRAEVLAEGPVASVLPARPDASVPAPVSVITVAAGPAVAPGPVIGPAVPVDARVGPRPPLAVASPDAPAGGPLSTDRRAEIDAWVATNAHATQDLPLVGWSVDAEGGERVAEAYTGGSSLGTLSEAETSYLAERALDAWQTTGSEENVRESVDGVEDATTRSLVAAAYATPAAGHERLVRDGQVYTTEESRRAEVAALEVAIELDPVAAVAAFEGLEGELGDLVGHLPGPTRRHLSETLLGAVADGRLDASSDAVSRMATALFLRSDRNDFLFDDDYRTTTSRALAEIMVDPADFTGLSDPQGAYRTGVERTAARYDEILASRASSRLLTDERIQPTLRGQAIAEIAANPAWTAEALRNGWESDVVSETFAPSIIDGYRARGTDPQVLGGEALRNTVGQALGFTPDLLPPDDESEAAAAARLDAGLDHAYYGANARIDALAARIEQLGGPNAEVTIMPVVVTSDDFGVATFNVFRVEGTDGQVHFVEDVDPNRHYTGFDDWQSNSRLPPGRMTYAEGLDWRGGEATLMTENTALVTDSFGEWARKVGDGAALVVGVGAGALIVVGTGGTALFVAAGAAGLYTTARGVEELADAHNHGEDITDLSDAEIRSRWLDVASGALSFGAIGSARGALKLSAAGSRLAPAATTTAALLQLGANGADFVAAGNQARDLAVNWNDLDNGQRALGLLNVAFWGGMTAASSRAGGGSLIDGYSFTRLRNNIEFGTPYGLSRNETLASGEMRVVYERGGDGRARGISIEYGGASADPAMLALHTRAARQVELSGGMLDRLRVLTGGEARAPVGSAAWEARIEIDKIGGESANISRQLADPALGAAERAGLELRLGELEAASVAQAERLDSYAVDGGEGWIASPSRGSVQAAARGWPDAPDGHVWVAGSGEPHLRRVDAGGDKLYYDPATALFTDVPPGAGAARRIGHGDNAVTWTESADGRTVSVSATLREFHTGAGRTADELAAQGIARARGIDGDHAGHIVGHRFVLDEGLQNLFPQDANLNTGAYKTLENELADWIAAGADVQLDVELGGIVDGRPATIDVRYVVTDPDTGRQVYANMDSFDNGPGQSFERIDSSRITPELTDPRLPPAPDGVR